jgi:hypothetical protein
VRRRSFRPDPPSKANKTSVALMVVTGATDRALANLTAEQLSHCYSLKLDAAKEMLERERLRRAAETAVGWRANG